MRIVFINSVYFFLILLCSCNHTPDRAAKKGGSNKLISCEQTLSITKQDITPYKIIDIRKNIEYQTGHIPNAINTWRPDYENKNSSVKGLMADKNEMQSLLQKWGVSKNDTLILYDGGGNSNSCRLWWILKQYGFDKVKILDGGFIRWRQLGYPLDSLVPKTEPSRISLADVPFQNYADIEDVQSHIRTNKTLLDSRTSAEFKGEIKKGLVKRGGHIPNAIRFDWSELVKIGAGENGTFRNSHVIRDKLAQLQVTEEDDIVVYCQSGVRSACVTFVLTEILGYKNVRNYDGSWLEWSNTNLDIER